MSLTINTPTARVERAFKKLSTSAEALNIASDDLSKAIAPLDAALKKLGLGVSAWVKITGNSDNDEWWSRDLGYARVNGKWGIALRDVSGHYQHPNDDDGETWLFNEAPRWLRIEGSTKLPDLLEKLIEQAEDTTKKVRARAVQVTELASIITSLVLSGTEQK